MKTPTNNRAVLAFAPVPHNLEAVAQRRLRQVATALARVAIDFEETERRLARLAARATRLRDERQALRDVLDRRGGRR